MRKKSFIIAIAVFVIVALSASVSYAASKEGFGTKVKNFWKNLIGYPGRLTEESASVIAETVKKTGAVVSNTTNRLGEVTTGDIAKTKELITEPITGTAETVVKAGEGTIKAPSEALKDKSQPQAPAQAQTPEQPAS